MTVQVDIGRILFWLEMSIISKLNNRREVILLKRRACPSARRAENQVHGGQKWTRIWKILLAAVHKDLESLIKFSNYLTTVCSLLCLFVSEKYIAIFAYL